VCEVAFFLYNEEADPSAPPSQSGAAAGISKLKADVLEIQYNQSATVTSNTATFPPGLNLVLKPIGSLQGVGGNRFQRIMKT
jgi:hypothetical protein